MIYTVTFNPSLDYIVSVDDFKLGMTNRTSSEQMLAGGKGINVASLQGQTAQNRVCSKRQHCQGYFKNERAIGHSVRPHKILVNYHLVGSIA